MDLLTYLQRYEPDNLAHVSGGEYRLRDHDSLRISNGKWRWWSQGIGGFGVLDYLVKVRGYPFPDAVLAVIGDSIPPPTISGPTPDQPQRRGFTLPEKHSDNKRVFAYLRARGIDPEIINHFIKHGYLYEQRDKHNAVFIGKDKDGNARYAALRGAYSDSVFVGEVVDSDKRYGFSVTYGGGTLCVYESAIDLLSFLTLRKMAGADWRTGSHLSLGSVHNLHRRCL